MDIRNFFAPTKSTVPVSKPQSSSTSAEKQPRQKKKSVPKTASPKSDEKPPGKGKKRVILDSDSDEEKKEERKPRKKSPKERERVEPVKRKDPIAYVSDTDSDNDTFVSLKASKHNSFAKAAKDADKGGFRPSPVTPPSNPSPQQTGKGEVKSPFSPAPPKSVPPQHKATPTSVLDYFGTSSVQRSDKKLVARTGSTGSTKRKAPTEDPEGSCHDEVMARRLQMEEDMELERQIHEDADFARTLAMLEEDAPQFKKARVESEGKSESGPSLSKSSSNQANSRDTKMCQAKSLSPKKSPSKSSAKLALLKRKAEQGVEKRRERTDAESGRTGLTPQRAPAMPSSSESAATPKSGSVTAPKTKMSPVKSETSPEEGEKKRQNSAAFRSYLNRDGPRALGSKEIPQGAENCLEGLTFVLTGVLESMERDDAKSLIERHGGKVTGNISRKTSYLVIGRDSGVSKTEKAEALGTKLINEDELLELVRSKPGRKSKYETAAETEAKATRPGAPPSSAQIRSPRKSSPCLRKPAGGQAATSVASAGPPTSGSGEDGANMLWVDKYRPRSLRNLIGQQGEQSCANKLLRWLQNWHSHHGNSAKAPPARAFGRFGGRDDGSGFKAALLSGPPGVGKTTSAALVCEEVGYSYVEMNASSTRSKNSLRDVIAESLNNTSIKTFYTGESQTVSSKHVLIMDEVDGMAGNEDRGGMQELIGLIKQTKIPIICMCNDRNQQKIRSLANYCFDLRYQRPRLEQIKGAMMSIAFKEGLKIPPPALNEIILASNQDVRQVLHNLSMWSAKDKVMTYDQAKADAKNARKDMKMGPFDVCRKVFAAGEETAHMSLIDKSDLFFHDYSLSPLFVQENYIHVRPAAAGGNLKSHLVLLSKAADSISDGDLVDKQIRSRQTWSLLPTQAIYASVLPGELMRGYLSQFPSFPSWLGRFSSRGKQSRILQELTSHMSLRTLSSKEAVNMDYVPYLRSALLNPLFSRGTEGAPHTVQLMDDYNIIREDLENIMEISSWGGQPDPYSKLDPKVKAALTRAYNKESHLTPYSLQAVKKGRRTNPEPDLGGHDPDHNNPLEEEEEEGMISDGMIKQKKPKAIKESKPEKAGDSGKGKGKAGDSGKDKGKAGDSGKGKGKGKGRR